MTSLTLLLLPGVWTAVGGFEGLRTALPAGHFSPAGGMSVSQILVFFLLGFQVYADPAAYQRFGASNSAKTAKRAYLTCLLIWMAFDAVMTMLGLGARALYPELQGSKAFLTMAINAMPPFLTGLWICSILAVIMSTMSSFFLVGATTLTCDLIKPMFRPCMTDREQIRLTRIFMVCMAFPAACWPSSSPPCLMRWSSSADFIWPPPLCRYSAACSGNGGSLWRAVSSACWAAWA